MPVVDIVQALVDSGKLETANTLPDRDLRVTKAFSHFKPVFTGLPLEAQEQARALLMTPSSFGVPAVCPVAQLSPDSIKNNLPVFMNHYLAPIPKCWNRGSRTLSRRERRLVVQMIGKLRTCISSFGRLDVK